MHICVLVWYVGRGRYHWGGGLAGGLDHIYIYIHIIYI